MFDSACVSVCTCVLRVYMCIESVHVCTVCECLYAEVITWLIIMSFAGVPFNGVY